MVTHHFLLFYFSMMPLSIVETCGSTWMDLILALINTLFLMNIRILPYGQWQGYFGVCSVFDDCLFFLWLSQWKPSLMLFSLLFDLIVFFLLFHPINILHCFYTLHRTSWCIVIHILFSLSLIISYLYLNKIYRLFFFPILYLSYLYMIPIY